jgi:hypothetical protein
MSSTITDSLAERTPRSGLRSGSAPITQVSDSSDVREPQLSPRHAAPAARIGDRLRPARARTPATPATPTLGRDAADALLQLQRQLDETRAQLALAHQLAECTARTAAVQAAADVQIQELRDELLRANAAFRAPTPAQPAADTAANALTMTHAISNLNAYVTNPELVKTVALGVVITVRNVSDVTATVQTPR